jgi:ABC-2 type transport system permease protein
MKWIRMSLLHFERTLEYRLRSFLWILIPMSNNLTLILFWSGAREQLNYISTYYIIMTIGGLFLTSHVEQEVADIDIKQGELVNYLTKPISYYWINFIGELPYRVLQAFYAAILIGVFILLFHGNLAVIVRPIYIPFVIIIFTLGYFISFTFKLSIAYLSFWFKDMRGFYELMTILSIIFSGAVMPLDWYPQGMRTAAHFLPFAYSHYYPIMTFLKPYNALDFLNIIFFQGVWLCMLLLLNRYLWKQGIKEFTAVGQ